MVAQLDARFFAHAFSPLEIDPEVDFDSRRAVYFRQMRYGLFVSFSVSSAASVL